MSNYEDFDLVFHLIGGQTIPIFLSALHFPPTTRHLLVVTRETQRQGDRLKACLAKRDIAAEPILLEEQEDKGVANDFPRLATAIEEKLGGKVTPGARCCVDITGATKPMSIMTLRWALARQLKCFYLDTDEHRCWWIDADFHFTATSLEPLLRLEDFFNLAGNNFQADNSSREPTIADLEFLFAQRETLNRFAHAKMDRRVYGHLAAGEKGDLNRLEFEELFADFDREMAATPGWTEFRDGAFFRSLGWEKKKKFLGGTWLEYYTTYQLKEAAKDHPDIKGVIQNPQALFVDKKESEQEFDVMYTDGYTLVIVECKTRPLQQADIQKLINLNTRYAGALGRSAMVTSLPASQAVPENSQKRINLSKIAVFCGKQGIAELGKAMTKIEPGQICGEE